VIDAFRLINPQLMMLGQEPRQTTSNLGHLNRPSIQVRGAIVVVVVVVGVVVVVVVVVFVVVVVVLILLFLLLLSLLFSLLVLLILLFLLLFYVLVDVFVGYVHCRACRCAELCTTCAGAHPQLEQALLLH